MGQLILAHEGTLERFTGDGMMVFFNDPVPVPDPAARATRMALAMRDRVAALAAGWRRRGYDLAVGIGIAQGYATLGAIGFEGRLDYGAIGTVTNLAARLCAEAAGGQSARLPARGGRGGRPRRRRGGGTPHPEGLRPPGAGLRRGRAGGDSVTRKASPRNRPSA